MSLTRPPIRRALRWGAVLGCLGYALLLVLVLVSHQTGRWPFVLFASFTPMLAIALLPVLAVSLFALRRGMPVILFLAIAAFVPFAAYDGFAEPTGARCDDGACTTIVMANLRRTPSAVKRLATQTQGRADVTVLVEVPWRMSEADLAEASGGRVLYLSPHAPRIGSRLAVIVPPGEPRFAVSRALQPQGEVTQRAYLRIAPVAPDSPAPTIVGVHPVWPKTASRKRARDAYLRAAVDSVSDQGDSVVIGDFNMTPWEPAFDTLPGRRAGDPRWIRTWNARGLESLTIDHALLGEGMELVAADTLRDIGSDHYPIRVTVRPR